MTVLAAPADLQPIKGSLVADLIGLLNLDLSRVVKESIAECGTCRGLGQVGKEDDAVTCGVCLGVGAVAAFVLDMEAIKRPEIGRHIEQWEYKQGQLVPKFRGKTQAFAQLTKLLGFDKAVLEVSQAVSFSDSLSEEQKAQLVEQVSDLARRGLL